MAISRTKGVLITVVVSGVLTAAITYTAMRRTIRKRCRATVKRELSKVPLLTKDFIDEQARSVCDA